MALHEALKRPKKLRREQNQKVSPKNFLRAQNIQNRLVAGLAPGQRAKLKEIDFNPVLGQSGDSAMAIRTPRARTLLTAPNFQKSDRGIRETLRHELAHHLLNDPRPQKDDTAAEHLVMTNRGNPKGSRFSPNRFPVPNLADRDFGGPGINPAGGALSLAKRAAAAVSSAAKRARR